MLLSPSRLGFPRIALPGEPLPPAESARLRARSGTFRPRVALARLQIGGQAAFQPMRTENRSGFRWWSFVFGTFHRIRRAVATASTSDGSRRACASARHGRDATSRCASAAAPRRTGHPDDLDDEDRSARSSGAVASVGRLLRRRPWLGVASSTASGAALSNRYPASLDPPPCHHALLEDRPLACRRSSPTDCGWCRSLWTDPASSTTTGARRGDRRRGVPVVVAERELLVSGFPYSRDANQGRPRTAVMGDSLVLLKSTRRSSSASVPVHPSDGRRGRYAMRSYRTRLRVEATARPSTGRSRRWHRGRAATTSSGTWRRSA